MSTGTEMARFVVMRRALKSALPWLRMLAGEKGRPETSAIHSVVREVEAAIATEAATAAETVKQGSVHEGAGPKDIAQTPIPSSRERK